LPIDDGAGEVEDSANWSAAWYQEEPHAKANPTTTRSPRRTSAKDEGLGALTMIHTASRKVYDIGDPEGHLTSFGKGRSVIVRERFRRRGGDWRGNPTGERQIRNPNSEIRKKRNDRKPGAGSPNWAR
jgi:hypothetical protein